MYIGIDPGLDGAVAIWQPGTFGLIVLDLPTVEVTRNEKKKRELATRSFFLQLQSVIDPNMTETTVMIEQVGAMPGQGVSSVFSFGRTYGAIEGVVASLGLSMRRVPPQVWTKKMKVRDGKDGARAMAMELFPEKAEWFARKKDHNRADAALLAYYASKWETL